MTEKLARRVFLTHEETLVLLRNHDYSDALIMLALSDLVRDLKVRAYRPIRGRWRRMPRYDSMIISHTKHVKFCASDVGKFYNEIIRYSQATLWREENLKKAHIGIPDKDIYTCRKF